MVAKFSVAIARTFFGTPGGRFFDRSMYRPALDCMKPYSHAQSANGEALNRSVASSMDLESAEGETDAASARTYAFCAASAAAFAASRLAASASSSASAGVGPPDVDERASLAEENASEDEEEECFDAARVMNGCPRRRRVSMRSRPGTTARHRALDGAARRRARAAAGVSGAGVDDMRRRARRSDTATAAGEKVSERTTKKRTVGKFSEMSESKKVHRSVEKRRDQMLKPDNG